MGLFGFSIYLQNNSTLALEEFFLSWKYLTKEEKNILILITAITSEVSHNDDDTPIRGHSMVKRFLNFMILQSSLPHVVQSLWLNSSPPH